MGNPYEEIISGTAPRTAPAARPSVPISQPSNPYEAFVAPPVAAQRPADGVDWSKFNKPVGEMRVDDPSPSTRVRRAGQDVMMTLGADPYNARKLSDIAVSGASVNPIIGSILSGADLPYNISRGNYGHAALDALGVVPGVANIRRAIKGTPTIPMAETPRSVRDPSFLPERGKPDKYGYGPGGTTGPQPHVGPYDELQAAGTAGYRRVANSPVLYHPSSIRDYIEQTVRELGANGAHGTPHIPQNSPEFYDLMSQWYAQSRNRTHPVTAAEWDAFRGQLRALPDGGSGVAGGKAAERLDSFMHTPPHPGYVVRGTPAELDSLRRDITDARGNWRAYKTAEEVEAELIRRRSSATSKGNDTGDASRDTANYFANTRTGENRIWGALPEERAGLRSAAEGSPTTRGVKYVGDMLGSPWAAAVGSSTGTGVAHMMGMDPGVTVASGVAGLALPKGVSMPFKSHASDAASSAVEDAIGNIRRNSPLYRERSTPGTQGQALVPAGAAPAYAPPAGAGPVADPFAMRRDAIAEYLLPKVKQPAGDIWDQAHVPYDNRDQEPPPPEAPPRRIYIDQPAESWDPALEAR